MSIEDPEEDDSVTVSGSSGMGGGGGGQSSSASAGLETIESITSTLSTRHLNLRDMMRRATQVRSSSESLFFSLELVCLMGEPVGKGKEEREGIRESGSLISSSRVYKIYCASAYSKVNYPVTPHVLLSRPLAGRSVASIFLSENLF